MPETSNPNRSYAAAHFALELDNAKGKPGLFRSIEGGSLKTDVMTYQHGGHYDRWRQLGKAKFEDIKVQVGMSMSQPFYAWIADFFNGKATRHNGTILAADFYYKERARREFYNALINELTFPKLDGSDKSAAYMSVGFAVENIAFKPGTGAQLPHEADFSAQKMWTACNFALVIHGIPDSALSRVSKIDSFTIKQTIVEHHVGGQLTPIKTPSQIDFPNLVFYVPEADAQPFIDRVSNKNGVAYKSDGRAPSGLTGYIQTYDNQGSPLFTVNFRGADVFSVTPDRSEASSEEIKHVKVEMYTEGMDFSYPVMELE